MSLTNVEPPVSIVESTMNTISLASPELGTPFAKKFEIFDEASTTSMCPANHDDALFAMTSDDFQDTIASAGSAASAQPKVRSKAFSWRPSHWSIFQRKDSTSGSITSCLRRAGFLRSSSASCARFDRLVEGAFNYPGLENEIAEIEEMSKVLAAVRNAHKYPIRSAGPLTGIRCSYSTTPTLVASPQTAAEDSDKELTKSSTPSRILTRKKKQENLRSKYQAQGSKSGDSSRNDEPAALGIATELSIKKIELLPTPQNDTLIWQDVFCICGRSFHPVHGDMSECAACNQWYHLRCVGVEHLSKHYKNQPFYCPKCEEIGVVDDWLAEAIFEAASV